MVWYADEKTLCLYSTKINIIIIIIIIIITERSVSPEWWLDQAIMAWTTMAWWEARILPVEGLANILQTKSSPTGGNTEFFSFVSAKLLIHYSFVTFLLCAIWQVDLETVAWCGPPVSRKDELFFFSTTLMAPSEETGRVRQGGFMSNRTAFLAHSCLLP